MKTIAVLNGPNLNMLGVREPHLYGYSTLDDVKAQCLGLCSELGVGVDFRQTNSEGEMIDWLHEAGKSGHAVVLNAAAFARTSLAIHDAVKSINVPTIEIHITNIYQRESYRPKSYLSYAAVGVITGFGINSYLLGIRAAKTLMEAGEYHNG